MANWPPQRTAARSIWCENTAQLCFHTHTDSCHISAAAGSSNQWHIASGSPKDKQHPSAALPVPPAEQQPRPATPSIDGRCTAAAGLTEDTDTGAVRGAVRRTTCPVPTEAPTGKMGERGGGRTAQTNRWPALPAQMGQIRRFGSFSRAMPRHARWNSVPQEEHEVIASGTFCGSPHRQYVVEASCSVASNAVSRIGSADASACSALAAATSCFTCTA